MTKSRRKSYAEAPPVDGFVKGSDVGFSGSEIKTIPTEELKQIRRSIYIYLTSSALKRRNANFREAFTRITKELAFREKMISNQIYNEAMKSLGVSPKKGLEYMKNKRYLCSKNLEQGINDLDIPKFFNDKERKINAEKIEKNIEKKEIQFEEDVYFTTFSSSPKVDLELKEYDYSVFKMVDPIEMALKKFAVQTKFFGEPITEKSLFQLKW